MSTTSRKQAVPSSRVRRAPQQQTVPEGLRQPKQSIESMVQEAVMARLLPLQETLAALPRIVADAAFTAVQQAPPRSGITCHTCFMVAAQWEAVHMTELKAAHLAAIEAAGLALGDPRCAQVDPLPYLRPELHPGGSEGQPAQFQAVVIDGGRGYCPPHVPGNPAAQAAGVVSRLIVAPGMPVHAAARFAMAGMAG